MNNVLFTELQAIHSDAVEDWDTIVKLAQQSTVCGLYLNVDLCVCLCLCKSEIY